MLYNCVITRRTALEGKTRPIVQVIQTQKRPGKNILFLSTNLGYFIFILGIR